MLIASTNTGLVLTRFLKMVLGGDFWYQRLTLFTLISMIMKRRKFSLLMKAKQVTQAVVKNNFSQFWGDIHRPGNTEIWS